MSITRTEAAIKNDLKGLGCYLEGIVKQTPSTADVLAAFCYAEGTIANAIYKTQAFQDVTITLTHAQILALATTPVQILPALAAGKYYELVNGFSKLTYGTAVLTTPSYNQLRIESPTGTLLAYDDSTIITGAASVAHQLSVADGGVTRTNGAVVVTAIADPTGSSSTSTITITLTYRIVTI